MPEEVLDEQDGPVSAGTGTFTRVRDVSRILSYHRSLGRDAAALQSEADRITGDIRRAAEQASVHGQDSFDLDRVDGFGSDVEAKINQIMHAHSILAGIHDAITRLDREAAAAEEAAAEEEARLNEGGDLLSDSGAPTIGGNWLAPLLEAYTPQQLSSVAEGAQLTADFVLPDSLPGEHITATLFQTPSQPTRPPREPGFVPHRDYQQPNRLLMIMPSGAIATNAAFYMKQTVYEPNAGFIAEGAELPEARFAFAEENIPVRELGEWIPVTERIIEDGEEVRTTILSQLRMGVMQKIDDQLINGTGAGEQLTGLLNVSGTQDEVMGKKGGGGADDLDIKDVYSHLFSAKKKVIWTGRARPTHYCLHPDLWQWIATRETESAGFYLGSPQSQFVMRMWGLPITESDRFVYAGAGAKTGLCGDFSGTYIRLRWRRMITTAVGWRNDDFSKLLRSFRATARVVLVTYRPSAYVVIKRAP